MRENRTSGFLEGRALKGVRLLDLLIRDIAAYVTEYGLSHLTTGDIMKWHLMLDISMNRREIPYGQI